MAKQKKKSNWFKKSTKIVGMDPLTYKESWGIKINRIQWLSIVLIVIILLFVLSYLIFSFTPLGTLLPENVKNRNKQEIENAAIRVSKLEKELDLQEKYITNLQNVILGKVSIDSVYYVDDTSSVMAMKDQELHVDTAFSKAEQKLDKTLKNNTEVSKQKRDRVLEQLFLYDPVEGRISQKFKIPNHPGVDIVTDEEEQIKACLNGIIIHSSYDDQDGNTIIISHKHGVSSVYKHAQSIYVKVGDHVKTGEAIGIVGNTGSQTSGPHLHFELWNEMGPLNPMDYFSFGK